jgi:hypothetical protein
MFYGLEFLYEKRGFGYGSISGYGSGCGFIYGYSFPFSGEGFGFVSVQGNGFGSGYVELEGNFKDYELECEWGLK